METKNPSKGLMGAGIITAIAASLCCITPVLALIAGSSGIASAFSWLEPARPYLIGLTVLVLGFAWYRKIKPEKYNMKCDCEEVKSSFLQSKMFLGMVTTFAALMLAFPQYAHLFYPKTGSKIVMVDSNHIAEADFVIEGMTCQGCVEEVRHEVSQLPGFIKAKVNHETGRASVKFDKTKNTLEDFVNAINKTGYYVSESK